MNNKQKLEKSIEEATRILRRHHDDRSLRILTEQYILVLKEKQQERKQDHPDTSYTFG